MAKKYSTPAEAFSLCYADGKAMIKRGDSAGLKSFVEKLRLKWQKTGNYIDKKAYNGASKAARELGRSSEIIARPPKRKIKRNGLYNLEIGILNARGQLNKRKELDLVKFSKLIGANLTFLAGTVGQKYFDATILYQSGGIEGAIIKAKNEVVKKGKLW